MSRPRKEPTLIDKLAATLRELLEIPHAHAKLMSAEQMISLVQFDHNEYHSLGGSDEHWNLTPLLIGGHRIKTKTDIKTIAHVKRVSREHEDFRKRLLTPRDQREPKKSKWASRPFQTRRKQK